MEKFVSPLIYRGLPYHDYGIESATGDVVSKKRGYWNGLTSGISGGGEYPKVNLSMGAHMVIKTILVHRAVAETLFDFPIPGDISKEDWKNTPMSVKNLVYGNMQVNHIDHDKTNYHPDNLEWVTLQENVEAAVKFYNPQELK